MLLACLLADVTFTDTGVAVIGGLLAALAAAIRILWAQDVRSREDQITDTRRQRDQLLEVIVKCHLRHREEEHTPRPGGPDSRGIGPSPTAGGPGPLL